jgi:predicted CopG family antitoxin
MNGPTNTDTHKYTDKYTENVDEMGHRTITISDEAYKILSSLKRDKESFTDVIKRVFAEPRKRPLGAFAGAWQGSDEELNRILGDIDELWRTYDAELRDG